MKPCILFIGLLVVISSNAWKGIAADSEIDFQRARELMLQRQRGQTLTAEDEQYLQRAREARRIQKSRQTNQPPQRRISLTGDKTGLVPLCDMKSADRYKGEDGGLYGAGRNDPPEEHANAAQKELARIQPLDHAGKPSPEGKVVLLSIGMSNTTQEFSEFSRLARSDARRNPALVIVDAALGGQDVVAWAESRPIPRADNATPWVLALQKLADAGVTTQQVQVVWLKQAKMGPAGWGEFPAHARKLADGMRTILNLAKSRFPNLRVAYLSSRIYAGHATTGLNPEPYAYESAFAVRWLIQDQIKGEPRLNYDPNQGPVQSPLLLWGPYLWAAGVAPRKSDGLVWKQADLAADGTHPSKSGREQVARLLLDFFKTNSLAGSWFVGKNTPSTPN